MSSLQLYVEWETLGVDSWEVVWLSPFFITKKQGYNKNSSNLFFDPQTTPREGILVDFDIANMLAQRSLQADNF